MIKVNVIVNFANEELTENHNVENLQDLYEGLNAVYPAATSFVLTIVKNKE